MKASHHKPRAVEWGRGYHNPFILPFFTFFLFAFFRFPFFHSIPDLQSTPFPFPVHSISISLFRSLAKNMSKKNKTNLYALVRHVLMMMMIDD